jgi:hypothetical protein
VVEARGQQQRRLALLVPHLRAHPRDEEELDADLTPLLRRVQEVRLLVRVPAQEQLAPRRVRPDLAVPPTAAAAGDCQQAEGENQK